VWGVLGLGYGVGGLGPTPKPPIPNPQSPIPICFEKNICKNIKLKYLKIIINFNNKKLKK
jgi:hypothetical protein